MKWSLSVMKCLNSSMIEHEVFRCGPQTNKQRRRKKWATPKKIIIAFRITYLFLFQHDDGNHNSIAQHIVSRYHTLTFPNRKPFSTAMSMSLSLKFQRSFKLPMMCGHRHDAWCMMWTLKNYNSVVEIVSLFLARRSFAFGVLIRFYSALQSKSLLQFWTDFEKLFHRKWLTRFCRSAEWWMLFKPMLNVECNHGLISNSKIRKNGIRSHFKMFQWIYKFCFKLHIHRSTMALRLVVFGEQIQTSTKSKYINHTNTVTET